MSLLEIAVETGTSGPVMKLSGECDFTTTGRLRDAMGEQIAHGVRHLSIDLSGLEFADSMTIKVFIDANQALKNTGGSLELLRPQPTVAKSLRLLGVDRLLTARGHRRPAHDPVTGMLEQDFNAESLHVLRETVLAYATAAGVPESRAIDVMLVAHELASNAIRHGGGTGRLRVRVASGAMHCQVTDPGVAFPSLEHQPWPYQRGHGLWLVREATDQFTVTTGPHGSQADVSFDLPGTP